jgi:DNA polymerase-3 subunit alpha
VKLIVPAKSHFDIAKLGDDDEATYQLLQSGNTTGVFQLGVERHEGPAGQAEAFLLRGHHRCLRPVPSGSAGSGMVDDFIDRKHGRKAVTYELSDCSRS